MLKQMEDYRGKFLMVVADYKDGIDMYLGLDAGLARRHGTRWELQAWAPKQAAAALKDELQKRKIPTSPAAEKAFLAAFEELATIPGYASGGDVRSLANLIIQAIAVADPDGKMSAKEIAALLAKAVSTAAELLALKKRSVAETDAANTMKNKLYSVSSHFKQRAAAAKTYIAATYQ